MTRNVLLSLERNTLKQDPSMVFQDLNVVSDAESQGICSGFSGKKGKSRRGVKGETGWGKKERRGKVREGRGIFRD